MGTLEIYILLTFMHGSTGRMEPSPDAYSCSHATRRAHEHYSTP
jgi:hypothetical protein